MINKVEFQKAAKDFRAGKLDIAQFTGLLYSDEAPAQPVADQTPTPESFDLGQRLLMDDQRADRCGWPEVIFAPGKNRKDLERASQKLLSVGQDVLITRIEADDAQMLTDRFPGAIHHPQGRTLRIAAAAKKGKDRSSLSVAVVTGGTSDIPVASECSETMRWMGLDPKEIFDVGVAGPQRLQKYLPLLQRCQVIVVIAGMEGALPSVVGGYVSCPVIAVPTSVGYGASFQGLAPLLGMLNSCAANVVAVNIDAGFKAGYLAGLIASGMISDSSNS